MLVFTEKNLVFLSMPKTASTAFIAALTPYASMIIKSPPGLKHMGLRRFNNRIRPLIEKIKAPLSRHWQSFAIQLIGSEVGIGTANVMRLKTNQIPHKMSALIALCRSIWAKPHQILPKLATRQNFYTLQKNQRQSHIYFNMRTSQG